MAAVCVVKSRGLRLVVKLRTHSRQLCTAALWPDGLWGGGPSRAQTERKWAWQMRQAWG